ncbi:hypothetical protein Y032_0009g528 [Ancylostoma ceylanicum]|uniref:G-protein coupled receptors family 1 profile domain-containing protein n=1 Tax=Ancylostoma ceylanicum TaxID=53326 RepID=A0A016VI81_9BILA|nr:hypothetical protein Y032_0009g528 [Ancylostoma ceylanicum]
MFRTVSQVCIGEDERQELFRPLKKKLSSKRWADFNKGFNLPNCTAQKNVIKYHKYAQFITNTECTTISEQQVRIIVGCAIVSSNLLLLVFLNTRSTMRHRYIFLTLVSIGDILDGTYLIYPSAMRIVEIAYGTFYGGTSLWECARKGYMVFRIYGTELASLTMLVMAAEQACAVSFTMIYRTYGTDRARFTAALACLLVCLLSLITMFLTSYFDPRKQVQEDKYCGVSGSVVEGFAQFHQFFNLSCQISAFFGSSFAYLVARYLTNHATVRNLNSILPIVVVSFISCIVNSSSNIVYILKNFVKLHITKTQQNYVVTYSSAVFQVSTSSLFANVYTVYSCFQDYDVCSSATVIIILQLVTSMIENRL